MRSSLSVAGGGERNAGICEIGKVYGPFRIKRVLGEGGTAVVYLAEHLSLRGEVALKVLRPQFLLMPDFLERFRGEGRALWELQHPNVVRVLHADDHEDLGPYISMEVLKGKSLAQMLSRSRLPVRLALSILTKLASALERIHAAGIIHRDLKPENIFICPGEKPNEVEAKLLDFGAAKIPKYESRPTESYRMMGTTLYVSPEQLKVGDITPASDVYTLGVIAHEMLSGAHPFARGRTRKELTPAVVNELHLTSAIPALSEVAPELGMDLSDVLATATAFDAGSRFRSMSAFAQALASARLPDSDALRAPPTVPMPTLRRPPMTYQQVLALPTSEGAWKVEDLEAAETIAGPAPMFSGGAPKAATVAWIEREDGSTRYAIREGETTVGRLAAESDIMIDERSLSGRHVRITARDGRMTIEDLQSSNGMKLNGKRVPSGALHVGDVLQLGRVHLRIVGTTDVSLAETEAFRSVRSTPQPVASDDHASIAETVTDGVAHRAPPDESIAETVTDGQAPPLPSYPPAASSHPPSTPRSTPPAHAGQRLPASILVMPVGWEPPPPHAPQPHAPPQPAHPMAAPMFFDAAPPTLSADAFASRSGKRPLWLAITLATVFAVLGASVAWILLID